MVEVVLVVSLCLNITLGLLLRRAMKRQFASTTTLFSRGRYSVVSLRPTGPVHLYIGDDLKAAKQAYHTARLAPLDWIEFFDGSESRGRRTS